MKHLVTLATGLRIITYDAGAAALTSALERGDAMAQVQLFGDVAGTAGIGVQHVLSIAPLPDGIAPTAPAAPKEGT